MTAEEVDYEYLEHLVAFQNNDYYVKNTNNDELREIQVGDLNEALIAAYAYEYGCELHGVNTQKAFKYYLIAAKSGDVEAMDYVADAYSEGIGCMPNTQEKIKWSILYTLHAIRDNMVLFAKSQWYNFRETIKNKQA